MTDSGEWHKIIAYADSTGVPYRVVSTYRPGSITATGNHSRHADGLAVDFAGLKASRDSDALLAINLAFKPVAALLHELIYSGPGGFQIYNGAPHVFRGVTRDNHHDHVHVSIDRGVVLPLRASHATPLPVTPTPPEEEDMALAVYSHDDHYWVTDFIHTKQITGSIEFNYLINPGAKPRAEDLGPVHPTEHASLIDVTP